MNNTKKRTLTAIAAILMAATLVVGTAGMVTTKTAFAASNNSGNTVTIEECKNKGSASGFDTAVNQECENLVHPKPTTGTLLVEKVCLRFQIPPPQPPCIPNPGIKFSIQITGNNPQPSTFILTPDTSGSSQQLVILDPGTFTIVESAAFPIFSATFSGDCKQTGSFTATGTISGGDQKTCTITNTIIQD